MQHNARQRHQEAKNTPYCTQMLEILFKTSQKEKTYQL